MSGGGGSTTTKQKLSPEQQELFKLVLPAARDISQNTPELFPGTAVASFNPLQEQGQQQVLQANESTLSPFVSSTIGGTEALQGVGLPAGTLGSIGLLGRIPEANNAASFLLNPNILSPDANPFTTDRATAAIRPVAESLRNFVLPAIRNSAIEHGQFGSSRQGIAEGLAIQEFQRQAGDISTNIFNQAFRDQLDAIIRALGTTQATAATGSGNLLEQGARSLFAAPSLADLILAPGRVTEAVGAQQRDLTQLRLTEEAQKFATEQILPFLIAQDIGQLAFGIPGGITTTSGGGGGVSPGQGALSGALAGSAISPGYGTIIGGLLGLGAGLLS